MGDARARVRQGRADIGSLEPGKAGDLFMIRRDRLELGGGDLDVKPRR